MTPVIGDPRVERWSAELLADRDPPGSWAAPALGADQEPATVVAVMAEAPDTVTLRLRRTRTDGFCPGQHFVASVPTGGQFPVLESYSVASSPWPDPSMIDLTVKEVPGGRVSPLLVRRIPVGAVLAIEGPFGYLTWSEADGGPLALIAAGSGIVPMMSIIRYAVARHLSIPVRLLCSSADRAHAIYHRHLADLARTQPWLEVVHTFTGDPTDRYARYHRRIDTAILTETFAPIATTCRAYVCGPPAMVRTVETSIAAIGVDPGRLNADEWE